MEHPGCHQLNVFWLSLPGVRLVTWNILAVISCMCCGCHSRVSDWLHGTYWLSSVACVLVVTPGCQIGCIGTYWLSSVACVLVALTPGCQIGYMEHTGLSSIEPCFGCHSRVSDWSHGPYWLSSGPYWLSSIGAVTAQLRGEALQVAFERQTLKPVFQLIGYRLWL
jgi:hypothetical protein